MAFQPGSSAPAARPMNIPVPDNAIPSYGSLRELVGSPDQLSSYPSQSEYFTPHPYTPGVSDGNSPTDITPTAPLRPRYGRSATSSSARRQQASSAGLGLPSSLLRFSRSGPQKGHEPEWTVFSELMGNETGKEPSSNSAASRPRDNIRDLLTPLAPTAHGHRSQTSPQSQGVRETLASQQTPQSPAYDLHNSTSTFDHSPINDTLSATTSPTRSSSLESDVSDHTLDEQPAGHDANRKKWLSLPTISPLHRNILKCSVAYFIGSLFTFSPYLSGFIADVTGRGPGERRPSPSGHMVATVAVYFNPAKTFGGMLEADTFCLVGLLFAALVSLSSMSMYWFFEVQAGWEWLADLLVILWIGLGMSAIAWMKMWMAKPTFNTACSMTCIILFIVVIKEGGLDTLLQVSLIVVVGSLISNVVCYVLWPQRATRNLQDTMTKTLDSFSTLLTIVTETFLLDEHFVGQENLQKATANHQSSFTALKKNLAEAQSERFFGGPTKPTADVSSRQHLGQAYEDAVGSLNRLGQHLNGLRSGISVQHEIVKASRGGKLTLRSHSSKFSKSNGKRKLVVQSEEVSEEDLALLQAAADAFGDIIDDLGPPLKALSSTCTGSLKRLREAFNERKLPGIQELKPEEFHELADSLERALFTFESTSNHAVLRLYRKSATSAETSIASLTDENSVLNGSDSESIFLVYFFFFTLQEFARELVSLVDAMSRICEIQKQNAEKRGWKSILTSPWKLVRSSVGSFRRRRTAEKRRNATLSRRLSHYFLQEPAHRSVSFPKITPHAPNTKQTPAREELSFTGRVKQSLWALGARLKEKDTKYSVKVGMATAMLAAPAFFDSTRPIFTEYRGEWALISFFVVISPTIGATNFMGVHRVLGTLLGAATAVAIWTAFPENAFVLSIFGLFFSMPCFYYIVARPQYATSARFVLLTYNLTCLYSYNLRQKDISVVDIAFHRSAAVTVGVVWAAIVSRYWWPTEARRELGKALGEFCLNIGWLYTRLVAFNSFENQPSVSIGHTETNPSSPTEATSLLGTSANVYLTDSITEFMAMELHLQIRLIELQGLLAQTQHEPRLKGPFPIKLYRSMLTSLQTILDKLHSMRCVTSREEWHTTVRKDFILPTNQYRREMVGNVILYFSTLAAAFRLKSPLPPYLPPAEIARLRLVDTLRQLDVVKNREVKGSRQLLFFAYALTMKGVIQELDYLGRTLQDTFGVIGESTEAFEALFRDTAHEVV